MAGEEGDRPQLSVFVPPYGFHGRCSTKPSATGNQSLAALPRLHGKCFADTEICSHWTPASRWELVKTQSNRGERCKLCHVGFILTWIQQVIWISSPALCRTMVCCCSSVEGWERSSLLPQTSRTLDFRVLLTSQYHPSLCFLAGRHEPGSEKHARAGDPPLPGEGHRRDKHKGHGGASPGLLTQLQRRLPADDQPSLLPVVREGETAVSPGEQPKGAEIAGVGLESPTSTELWRCILGQVAHEFQWRKAPSGAVATQPSLYGSNPSWGSSHLILEVHTDFSWIKHPRFSSCKKLAMIRAYLFILG